MHAVPQNCAPLQSLSPGSDVPLLVANVQGTEWYLLLSQAIKLYIQTSPLGSTYTGRYFFLQLSSAQGGVEGVSTPLLVLLDASTCIPSQKRTQWGQRATQDHPVLLVIHQYER